MKRILLLFTFVIIGLSTVKAQCPGCVINMNCLTTPAEPSLCPDTLPFGTALQPYDEDLTFFLPASFTDAGSGYTVDFEEMQILSISGIPMGLNWQANEPSLTYYPNSNPPATERGCAKICGTPLVAGNYMLTVFVRVEVSVPSLGGISQTVNEDFDIPLIVLPGTGGNASFSMTNPQGCAPLTSTFTSNFPSNGNPNYHYNWNFGNGNQSIAENPLPQDYLSPGDYIVTLETIIDTFPEYYINSVEITSTSCDDGIWSDPDLYIKIKQNGSTVYESAYVPDDNPPVTIAFPNVNLNSGNYTMEIWDDDDGALGGDDHCGTVSFNGHNVGVHTLTDGADVVIFEIQHPVVILNETDTINVYPSPAIPLISYLPNDTVCPGTTVAFSSDAQTGNQWYKDGSLILNQDSSVYQTASSGIYHTVVTNHHGCFTASETDTILVLPVPAKPTFWYSGQNELSTNVSGVNLQWYLNGQPVAGATGQVFTYSASGQVWLTSSYGNGCFTSSDTVSVTWSNVGIAEQSSIEYYTIYPNPNSGQFTLEMLVQDDVEQMEISIHDISGRKLSSEYITNLKGIVKHSVNTSSLPRGFYILQLDFESQLIPVRFIKN